MHSMACENKYLCSCSTRWSRVDWPIFKFILASESIILSRDGHHVLSIVKIRISCIMYLKIWLITKNVQWFVCRHLAKISSRKRSTLGAPKVAPTKNRKFIGFGRLFLMKPANLFYLLQLFYFTLVFPSGRGTFHPLYLRPCSWAYQIWENSLRNDIFAKYAILTMDPAKMQAWFEVHT